MIEFNGEFCAPRCAVFVAKNSDFLLQSLHNAEPDYPLKSGYDDAKLYSSKDSGPFCSTEEKGASETRLSPADRFDPRGGGAGDVFCFQTE